MSVAAGSWVRFGLIGLLALALGALLLSPASPAGAQSGSGTVDYDTDGDNLIEVSNLAQLNAIRYDLDGNGTVASGDQANYDIAFPNALASMGCAATCTGYELDADLDFNTDTGSDSGGAAVIDADDDYYNGGDGWEPLGDSGPEPLMTTFEGNNHTISNLFINRTGSSDNYIGLFGQLGGATVTRVHLVGAKVTGNNDVGALVGHISLGTVSHSSSSGTVSGVGKVGGLVGAINSDRGGVEYSRSGAVVTATGTQVGGLIGFSAGQVRVSYATGAVTGSNYVGGLVGNHTAAIFASYATGAFSSNRTSGGLVGWQGSAIAASYATGAAVGSVASAGGLIGVGGGGSSMTNSYWDVDTSGIPNDNDAHTGVGKTTVQLQSPTQTDGYAGIYANWNIDVDADSNVDDPWDFGTASEYPALKADSDGDGRATAYEFGRQGRSAPLVDYDDDNDGLIEVVDLDQLNAMRWDLDGDGAPDVANANDYALAFHNPATGMGCPDTDSDAATPNCTGYELDANLDFNTDTGSDSGGAAVIDAADDYYNTGSGWEPIGDDSSGRNTWYNAIFEGNGHTISNLFISRAHRWVGLFGISSEAGFFRNVGLVDVNVTGWGYTGALIGHAYGTVDAAYSTGIVVSNKLTHVGGLVGHLSENGSIQRSYSTASVTGFGTRLGGLVGTNRGPIRASYATGAVAGSSIHSNRIGGLVGESGGDITASYATGSVTGAGSDKGGLIGELNKGTITNSYWDVTSSGIADDSDATTGVGKTTLQLQSPAQTDGYAGIYADWDIDVDNADVDDDTTTETDDPWDFGTASEYPALKAEWDGDGTPTAYEFGRQGRSAPSAQPPANAPPTFNAGYNASPNIAEGETAVGTYAATDPEGDQLTYAVTGTDASDFAISGAGALTLASASNHETKESYSVNVTVHDGKNAAGGADTTVDLTLAITVTVDDTLEPPTVPTSLGVVPAANGLTVTWTAPVMPSTKPALDDYDVQHALRTSGDGDPAAWAAWVAFNHVGTGTTATITGLVAGSTYQVQVMAKNNEGESAWTAAVNGVPAAPVDYDLDDDGLIEVDSLTKLNAIRWDLDGDGAPASASAGSYAAVFPYPEAGMGCPITNADGDDNDCTGYELTADLDFDQNNDKRITSADAAWWNSGAGWAAIGNWGAPFNATFDGGGHTVSHMYIRVGGGDVGLFGSTDTASVIRNLGMVSPSIDRTGSLALDSAAAVAGSNRGTIDSVFVTGGSIWAYAKIGGVAGHNRGTVSNSYSRMTVTGNTQVGGLVGWNETASGIITNSYAAGGVATHGEAGTRGGVSGTNAAADFGGLVGKNNNSATVTAGYWDTEASGQAASAAGAAQTTAGLQSPTGATGIYSAWGTVKWDFGTTSQYPALKYDTDGVGGATWQEFGGQVRIAPVDYDTDNDGLIEVDSLVKLNAIRYDLNGDGGVTPADKASYDTAFPNAQGSMGCLNSACAGYELTDDLNFDQNNDNAITSDDTAWWNSGAGWAPIGDWANPFNATFDGRGHTISNLYIRIGGGDVGLFGSTDTSSVIRNLGMVNPSIDRTGALTLDSAAAVAGSNRGAIQRVFVSGGSIWAFSRVGGVAGDNRGAISDSYSRMAVTGNQQVGGLVGRNMNASGTITNSYAMGKVATHGLTGTPPGGGSRQNPIADVGGLVGQNSSGAAVTASYWDTEASRQATSAGGAGAVGQTTAGLQSPTGATGIYLTWAASTWDFGTASQYPALKYDTNGIGGATWQEFGSQARTAPPPPTDYDTDDDGLIEVDSLAQLNAIRYDLDGNGAVTAANQASFDHAFPNAAAGMGCAGNACTGYELTDDLNFDTDDDGDVDSSDDYPSWTAIGAWATPFTATFDGGGHTISNMRIRAAIGDQGLFGSINSPGVLRNVAVLDVDIDRTGSPIVNSVGGLVGSSRGAVERSYTTGAVTGFENVGGLVGDNRDAVTNSYSSVTVNGNRAVGGLVGFNRNSTARITNSYAVGAVSAVSMLVSGGNSSARTKGGLVGEATADATVTAGYWDATTSAQAASAGGAGAVSQNTAGLQSPTSAAGIYSTWAAATWDFGTSSQYPALKYDTDKDSTATAYEFGRQGRAAPGVGANTAPVFTEGASASRSVPENTAATTNIGAPLAATDADSDRLTYAIVNPGVSPGSHFAIDSANGQLKVKDALDYETTTSYSITVTVSDGNGGSDSIAVTITVTNVNEAPTFTAGAGPIARSVPENAGPNANVVGGLVAATDVDSGDSVTYALSGAGANLFSIDSTGQIKAKASLDYETAVSYAITVTATDTSGATDTILVNIAVGNANEPPTVPSSLGVVPAANGLVVTWTAPVMPSTKPALDDYDVQHSLRTSAAGDPATWGAWVAFDHVGTGTTATITGLVAGSTYQVQVMAKNNEGSSAWTAAVTGVPASPVDYDLDDDGLIEVDSLTKLNAIRWDLDGDGAPASASASNYAAVFPYPGAGMGCPITNADGDDNDCKGYELTDDLTFDSDADGDVDIDDHSGDWWNTGDGWTPLGNTNTATFSSVFEGNGKTISRLFINRASDEQGLFGAISADGEVHNLGLPNVNVTGRNFVGGLAGLMDGEVTSSYVTGSVTGSDSVGGLAGRAGGGSSVTTSYSTAGVTGAAISAGGLIGYSYATVTASYATGSVVGSDNVGGLVGANAAGSSGDGSIIASYATGAVTSSASPAGPHLGGLAGDSNSTITNSYWDVTTTGIADDNDATTGVGKTTSDLKTPTAYGSGQAIYANWNVDVDGDSNADDPWDFGTPNQYPALKVEWDGDSTASAYEFGRQGRSAPAAPVQPPANAPPVFDAGADATPNVAEGATAVGTYAATDPDSDTLTYAVTGTDASYFAISGLGVLTLNDAANHETKEDYSVSVTVHDGKNAAGASDTTVDITVALTVTVDDTLEPPTAPTNLQVFPEVEGLRVTWTAPVMPAAKPPLSDYDVQHALRTSGDGVNPATWGAWVAFNHVGTGTTAAITGLVAGSTYKVQVMAKNAEGSSRWTAAVNGATLAQSTDVDYDSNGDGLIEVDSLAKLNAMRWDLDGDGAPIAANADDYALAFPTPVTGMGCPDTDSDAATSNCLGYELTADLDFDTNGSGTANSGDTYWNTGAGWTPIGDHPNGTGADGYTAVFEGNGHTVANLFINQPAVDRMGLFGTVGETGVLRNLAVVDADVTGERMVGTLAGYVWGTVKLSYATGSVHAAISAAGGLVGVTKPTSLVSQSYAAVDASATLDEVKAQMQTVGTDVGGLVGQLQGRVEVSYATGSVSGQQGVGGLVGRFVTGAVEASYSTGRVQGNDRQGGLVGNAIPGRSAGTVTNSYWDTRTSGQTSSAGGTGKTTIELMTPTAYGSGSDIYANWNLDLDGDTNSDDDPWDFGTASEYPALKADWDGNSATAATAAEFGSQARTAPIFADGTSTTVAVVESAPANQDIPGSPAARGPAAGDTLTYALSGTDAGHFDIDAGSGQLKTRGALERAVKTSYSVVVTATYGSGASATITVTINVAVDYDTDSDGLIEVSSLDQLDAIRRDLDGDGGSTYASYARAFLDMAVGMGCPDTDSDADTSNCLGYELMRNLDFDTHGDDDAVTDADTWWNDGDGWHPLGGAVVRGAANPKYEAIFEGNGFTISNMLINLPNRQGVGLFGALDTDGVIRNLGLVNATVTAKSVVGPLAGLVAGTVESSYATGSVTGSSTGSGNNVGGLVGSVPAGGRVLRSYTTASVSSSGTSVGGLAGFLRGTIKASYAAGNISGSGTSVGGLVGEVNGGTVTASYARGEVQGANLVGGLVGRRRGSATVTDSYWDTETSGQGSSARGVGKTTSELRTPAQTDGYAGIYANWNLDLDGDSNTDDDPWDFGTGSEYPALKVEWDGDNTPSAYEFGRQGRSAPAVANGAPTFGVVGPYTPDENQTAVGTIPVATDPENDSLTYEMMSGAGDGDHALFTFVPGTRVLTFKAAPNYEATPTKTTYTVKIRVRDSLNAGGTADTGWDNTVTVTINLQNVNEAPAFGVVGPYTPDENQTAVGTIPQATDPENDSLTYEMMSGAGDGDHALFTFVPGTRVLTFKAAPNYEATPTKTTYTVKIRVRDSLNAGGTADTGWDDTVTVTINLQNVNEVPAFGVVGPYTPDENQTAVGTIPQATDPDAGATLTYEMMSGAGDGDHALFTFVPGTRVLTFKAAPNFEIPPSAKTTYTVKIRVRDSLNAGGTADTGWDNTVTVTINLQNVNEAPAFGVVGPYTPDENQTAVGTIPEATDPDAGATLTYQMMSGASDGDHALFTFVPGTRVLTFKAAPNFEIPPSAKTTYTVKIRVRDSLNAGGTADTGWDNTVTVTINLQNVNEAPAFGVVGPYTPDENQTAVGTIPEATDPDAGATLTYQMMEGAGDGDHALFTFVPGTRVLTFKAAPNFEIPPSAKTTYTVKIRVRDSLNAGGTADTGWDNTVTVTINLQNVNEAPAFGVVGPYTPDENQTAVGTIPEATDPDAGATLTYQMMEGASDGDHALFTFVPGTRVLTFKAAPNYEATPTKTTYTVKIRVRDSLNAGGTADTGWDNTVTVTINLQDVNEEPEFMSAATTDVDGNLVPAAPIATDTRSFREDAAADAAIGAPVAATDPDTEVDPLDTLTYALAASGDHASFAIDTATGQLKTKAGVTYDYEAKDTYTVTVTVHDGKNAAAAVDATVDDTITVTINVTDALERWTPPTGLNIDVVTLANRIRVTWTAPAAADNTGKPALTGYKVEWRQKRTASAAWAPDWVDFPRTGLGVMNDITTYTVTAADGTTTTYTVATGGGSINEVRVCSLNTDGAKSTDSPKAEQCGSWNGNALPAFTEGTKASRSVAENTPANTNIGNPIAAADSDAGDTLVYSMTQGTHSAKFTIDTATGQLKTKDPLDHETAGSYDVYVKVNDGNNGIDGIMVTITVTDVNEPPAFDDGAGPTTRSVSEGAAAGDAIGDPVEATDPDTKADPLDTLTYALDATTGDHANFEIDTGTGQLKVKDALDYETKSSYTVTVQVRDSLSAAGVADTVWDDTIVVNISVGDVNEAPVFTAGAGPLNRSVAENAGANANVGLPVPATDVDDGDSVTLSLSGTGANLFSIDSNGQIKAKASLDYETAVSYAITVTATDTSSATDTILVNISVTDVDEPPTAPTGVAAVGIANGLRVTWTAPVMTNKPTIDGYDVEYSLRTAVAVGATPATWGAAVITDAGLVLTHDITGLTPDSTYRVRVRAKNAEGISGWSSYDTGVPTEPPPTNMAPSFDDGASTTRSVAENTAAGTAIGNPIAATDTDAGDTLVYAIDATTGDHAHFAIDSATGQLKAKGALDYESGTISYSIKVTVSDGNGGTDSITVTITVTSVNEAPVFTAGAGPLNRSVAENAGANANVGLPVPATDVDDGDSVTLSLSGTGANLFSIDSNGQIKAKASLDYETAVSYAITVTATDTSSATDTILVNISVTDVDEPPTAPTGVAAVGIANGLRVTWTAPVMTNKPTIDGYDVEYSLRTAVAVGATPATWGAATTSAIGVVEAYEITGLTPDSTYRVRVRAKNDEGPGGWTAYVTGVPTVPPLVNADPTFGEGADTSRSVPENTAAGTAIGNPIAATDTDASDTLVYAIDATTGDHGHFAIDSTNGQLKVKSALDYESNNRYTVVVTVSDGNGGTDSITVTIDVDDVVNEAPVVVPPQANVAPSFDEGASASRNVAENTPAGRNIGSSVGATDHDNDVLRYELEATGDHGHFAIDSSSGQLKTKGALDYESKSSYAVTVIVWDGNGGTDSIPVTIRVTNVDDTPTVTPTPVAPTGTLAFDKVGVARRTVDAYAPVGTAVGAPVTATVSAGMAGPFYSVYTRSSPFTVDRLTGQLRTARKLGPADEYTIQLLATDGKGRLDVIGVIITVTGGRANRDPVFREGASATRSVVAGSSRGVRVGRPVTATDPDGDALFYMVSGTDSSHFSIGSGSGQIKVGRPLTKSSYSFEVVVGDLKGGVDVLDITITVTAVDEAPVVAPTPQANRAPSFDEGASAGRSVAENTPAGRNIGSSVGATDHDNDVLRYELEATGDHGHFAIDSSSGQLKTKGALDYESKSSYAVTVIVWDGNGGTDSIPVTIRVTNVDEAPVEPTPQANRAPSFDEGAGAGRSVAENTPAGTDIGLPLAATDPDSDSLTYALSGADSGHFALSGNQLRTSGALDYEGKSSYSVTVTVSDGRGGTDTIAVTVTVTNVNEPPGALPGLGVFEEVNGLRLSWSAPDMRGKPPVTGYDVQYKLITATAWNDHAHSGAGTTIQGLTAGSTYKVRVRAKNAEGNSGWASAQGTPTAPPVVAVPPGAPRNLEVTPGYSKLRLTWNMPDMTGKPPITHYEVQYKLSFDKYWGDFPHDSTVSRVTIDFLGGGLSYDVRVRAVNSAGNSGWVSSSGTTK